MAKQLLIKLKSVPKNDIPKIEKEIFNLLGTETTLRSKRELIEKFIKKNLPIIEEPDLINVEFDKYWTSEQQKAFSKLIKEENLSPERTEKMIEDYLFAEHTPHLDKVLNLLEGEKPVLLNRKKVDETILNRIMDFIETFMNGVNG